ncbi:MAG: alkaline phosphatase D family protein, partial [Bacteroidota bacterium]
LVEPGAEIISLFDYRARYSTYRLDTNLIRLHQQHPIISVWDDHESANDSYVDGAENHTEGEEGEWETRKAISKQVYFEWMPIRDNEEQQVYRTLSYGNLADLIMLDTRLEGREQQITSILDTALFAPDRTLLGVDQKAWFLQQLLNSTAKWKVIGQQVIFSEFNVGWAGSAVGATFEDTESLFLDIWDGYPAERAQIVSFLSDNDVDNVVFLTGDFHSSFAFDVGLPSVDLVFQDIPGVGTVPFYNQSPTYDPATGDGSVAVEFATPSINSANFDENAGFVVAVGLQAQINAPIITGGIDLGNPNPHMKYAELIQHGYYILDIKGDSTQANYYYTPILEVTNDELFAAGYYTLDAENHLNAAAGPSEPKEIQDTPAPLDPPPFTSSTRNVLENLRVLAVYPNPAKDIVDLQYALNAPSRVRVELLDANGRALRTLRDERLGTGLYTLRAPVLDLPAGTYFLRLSTSEGQISQVILKK